MDDLKTVQLKLSVMKRLASPEDAIVKKVKLSEESSDEEEEEPSEESEGEKEYLPLRLVVEYSSSNSESDSDDEISSNTSTASDFLLKILSQEPNNNAELVDISGAIDEKVPATESGFLKVGIQVEILKKAKKADRNNITKEQFLKYAEIQNSGLINMINISGVALMSEALLTLFDVNEIITYYDHYYEKFN